MLIYSLPQQSIELFHLIFLSHFGRNADKSLYALKGGCNLRFFFGSIRYSEDLDLDVKTMALDTLKNKVRRILKSAAFVNNLMVKGLKLTEFTEPKQTETVQRWKCRLKHDKASLELNTKIEFSRRRLDKGLEFDPVEARLIAAYHLLPVLTSHYGLNAAALQKIGALHGRSETQARDVFDLQLLLNQGARLDQMEKSLKEQLPQALENMRALQFSDFKGQVVAYLMPEFQSYYDSPRVWQEMVEAVTMRLNEAA